MDLVKLKNTAKLKNKQNVTSFFLSFFYNVLSTGYGTIKASELHGKLGIWKKNSAFYEALRDYWKEMLEEDGGFDAELENSKLYMIENDTKEEYIFTIHNNPKEI